jgi:hypothetical protein
MTGVRAPGPLVTTPTAGVLPSVASYAPLLYGARASNAGSALPPPIDSPPPLYTTALRSAGAGELSAEWAALRAAPHGTLVRLGAARNPRTSRTSLTMFLTHGDSTFNTIWSDAVA